MTMTLNISDDLKTDELGEVVDIAREQNKPVGVVLLEAARKLAAERRERRLELKQPTLSA